MIWDSVANEIPTEPSGSEMCQDWFKLRRKRASGTPFISFFTPDEILTLARDCGFKRAEHVSAGDLIRRYFAARTDGLRPPDAGEEFLVAGT